jgi:hypothetical protein
MSSFEPIPLAIGFTGHRDISPDDEDRLRAALRERLNKLQAASKPTRLRAFAGLAEGGDMLFVEAAAELGIEIIGVLPVPVEDFVRDFEHPAHPHRDPAALRQRFEGLLKKTAGTHVVPVPSGRSLESVKSYGPPRDDQYAAAGAFIVRQSSILIALWNGVTTDKPGGTGDVVRFKRDGVPPQPGETEDFPAPPDGGPVLQLGTTRVDSMGDVEATWRDDSYPEPQGPFRTEFNKALKQLRRFNRDALGFAERNSDRVAKSRHDLLAPGVELDPTVARMVNTYAVADAMAISLQRGAHLIFVSIAVLAVLMVIAFELYGHLPVHSKAGAFIVAYAVFFFVANGVYWFEHWRKIHARFLDYRCLAEGLRVQIFWRLAGLTDAVADNYLHQVRSELRWIRDALRSAMVGVTAAEARLDLVRQRWVWHQSDFFTAAAKRERTYERLTSWLAASVFAVGFIITITLGVLEYRADPEPLSHGSPIIVGALLAIAFVSAVAGAIKGFAITRAYAEHAKQYGRMARIFSLARKRLDSIEETPPMDRSRGVLIALGREALAENAEWILLHRERQIEPPI